MSTGIIAGERCPYCTKFRSPEEIIRRPGGNVTICVECEHRHEEAIEALTTGSFNGRCSECDLPLEELVAQKRCGPAGIMAVHYENGVYRMVCQTCDQIYLPKRRDLYGGTQFWKEKGLD